MAGGVNKVILVGNLGAESRGAFHAQRASRRQLPHRHERELDRQVGAEAGTHRVAPDRGPGEARELCDDTWQGPSVLRRGSPATREWTDKEKKNYRRKSSPTTSFPRRRGEGAAPAPTGNGASDFGFPPPEMDELTRPPARLKTTSRSEPWPERFPGRRSPRSGYAGSGPRRLRPRAPCAGWRRLRPARRRSSSAAFSREDAEAHLSNPHVLHRVASRDEAILGPLFCHLLRCAAAGAGAAALRDRGAERVAPARRRTAAPCGDDRVDAADGIATAWALADNPGADDSTPRAASPGRGFGGVPRDPSLIRSGAAPRSTTAPNSRPTPAVTAIAIAPRRATGSRPGGPARVRRVRRALEGPRASPPTRR